eukprot:COSAG02_NODE_3594_length_6513_cov_21.456813_2_plen_161_part_00
MTDLDGRTDLIWHAVGPRTVQAAARYFNCSSLTSVPLMGENQLGDRSRGSHWETRILNDEVMSYGESKMVSELTLAMMEDLGLYLGNYSRSQCMFWGRFRVLAMWHAARRLVYLSCHRRQCGNCVQSCVPKNIRRRRTPHGQCDPCRQVCKARLLQHHAG